MAETNQNEISVSRKTTIEDNSQSFQIIVFKLGQEEYALMIDQIKEVVITPNIAKIPLTSSYIKGVANIRGDILAIVDLEEKFGITQSEASNINKEGYYSLVVESDSLNMAILVKEVPNTLSVTQSDIDASPNLIADQQGDKNYIKGIVKLADRIIILIDIYSVIDKSEVTSIA